MRVLSEKPKILCLCNSAHPVADLYRLLDESPSIVETESPHEAIEWLRDGEFAGLFLSSSHASAISKISDLEQLNQVLRAMPDGVALLDDSNTILWGNQQLHTWCGVEELTGENFYTTLGSPEILGPDFCPFHTALATRNNSTSTLKTGDNLNLQVHTAPVLESDRPPRTLIVTIRDVTSEMLHQQKLTAIHNAGVELADLTPQEVFDMEIDDRIELLKSNILHYTKDLLNFDVVEIRLLDQKTSRLDCLLSVGIDQSASDRSLHAHTKNNGVTGFVAATGKSYLCEDTTEDPLYLEGFKGAKSSLTVPLVLHDHVIGTFNVESPKTRAFSESDLQFLELFSRDVALALNTLELLVAQMANAAQESVEAIHSAVAMPVDEILNNAVNVMERYIGHEPDLKTRLQSILRNAREVKQIIQKVGQKMTPAEAVPVAVHLPQRPKLRGRRILVVDADEHVRSAAHDLLEKYSCIVETAHTGGEAVFMVRYTATEDAYDVVIADVRLPDMTGHELYLNLREIMEHVPMMLMSGFGYDPGHSIVKARQSGLNPSAVLFKPFRLDQLLETVEMTLESQPQVPQT